MKMSKKQEEYLRLIASCKDGRWAPGDRWVSVEINDGLEPNTICVGGGSAANANALMALVRKGYIEKPYHWWFCIITEKGREAVEEIKRIAKKKRED